MTAPAISLRSCGGTDARYSLLVCRSGQWEVVYWPRSARLTRWIQRVFAAYHGEQVPAVVVDVQEGRILHRNPQAEGVAVVA